MKDNETNIGSSTWIQVTKGFHKLPKNVSRELIIQKTSDFLKDVKEVKIKIENSESWCDLWSYVSNQLEIELDEENLFQTMFLEEDLYFPLLKALNNLAIEIVAINISDNDTLKNFEKCILEISKIFIRERNLEIERLIPDSIGVNIMDEPTFSLISEKSMLSILEDEFEENITLLDTWLNLNPSCKTEALLRMETCRNQLNLILGKYNKELYHKD